MLINKGNMEMTRLNVSIRNRMINKALTVAGVDAEFTSLIKRRATLASNIRFDSLGGAGSISKIEKHFEKITKLKHSDLIENVSVYSSFYANSDYELNGINLGGMRVNLQYSGEYDAYSDTNKRVKHKIVPVDSSVTYAADHNFTKEFLLIEGDYKTTCEKRDGLHAQVKATLDQFTTIKKLLEAWPEAKDLLPDDVDEVKPKLPVVQVQDLNCLIGLPEDKA